MANSYNYSDGNLSSGAGRFEEIVRRGMIDNTSGLYTPKIDAYASAVDTSDLPSDQVIPDYDKRRSYIYYNILLGDYSREFVNYSGFYGIEFLVGYEDEASEWKNARLKTGKSFREMKNDIDSTIFVLNEEDSKVELTRLGLNKDALVKRYDEAKEISKAFSSVKRQLDPELSREYTFKSIDEVKQDLQLASDLKLFSDDILNRPEYFFGDTTVDDVGFYRDKGNRIRAGYDPSKAYRSQRLVEDLLKYGKPEEYAVAKYPEGTMIFVLSVPLSERLVNQFGDEAILARRWNDLTLKPKQYDPTIFEGFEHAIDPVNKGRLIPANDLFGNATNSGKK